VLGQDGIELAPRLEHPQCLGEPPPCERLVLFFGQMVGDPDAVGDSYIERWVGDHQVHASVGDFSESAGVAQHQSAVLSSVRDAAIRQEIQR
jgi:hypothetical protein